MTPEQNIEQELADAISSKIDALLSGAPIPSDDPLLKIAELLKGESVQPSAAATTRFEQQLSQWFPRRPPVRRFGRYILLIIVLIVLTIGLVISLRYQREIYPAEFSTPPATSATITFVGYVVSGTVESVQGSTITILGKTIVVEGTMIRLCAGDVIRIEAVLDSDGSLRAKAKSITVQTSACSIQPPQSSGGMGDMGGDD